MRPPEVAGAAIVDRIVSIAGSGDLRSLVAYRALALVAALARRGIDVEPAVANAHAVVDAARER